MSARIGIFGGTFNPPHIGHVAAAEAFADALNLDELIIMPDYLPPHKDYVGDVTPEQRLEMCRLAFSHIKNSKVSELEILRGGKSYTSDTLSSLEAPDTHLYFLCGTDMFLTLHSWHAPEIIFNLATICYVRRESDRSNAKLIDEHTQMYKEKYNADIIFIDGEVIDISSSELRSELKLDGVSAHIPDNVMIYIKENGLYT